jgi:hypothetical protein
MVDIPLTLGSQTISVPQLPASNSNNSQFTKWIEFGWSSHMALEWTHREYRLEYLFYSVPLLRMWRVPLLLVYRPLPSNGSTCNNIKCMKIIGALFIRLFWFEFCGSWPVCDYPFNILFTESISSLLTLIIVYFSELGICFICHKSMPLDLGHS